MSDAWPPIDRELRDLRDTCTRLLAERDAIKAKLETVEAANAEKAKALGIVCKNARMAPDPFRAYIKGACAVIISNDDYDTAYAAFANHKAAEATGE